MNAYDLNTKEGKNAVNNNSLIRAVDFFRTGQSNFRFEKFPVFSGLYCNYIFKNSCVYKYDIEKNLILDNTPYAIIQNGYWILNGDEGYGELVSDLSNFEIEYSVLSFECLRRFYHQERWKDFTSMKYVVNKLTSGKIKLIDFTPETILKKKPQQLGFTLIADNAWHRAGTVLLYDMEEKFSIIIGYDEGAYFGCQLIDNPKTVNNAFLSLVPKNIRNIKGVKRQGEWFIVPVSMNEVPAMTECSFLIDGEVILPIDNINSNRHEVSTSDGRIKDNTLYAFNSTIYHNQHDNVYMKEWCKYIRNTAVRSFSVVGVD